MADAWTALVQGYLSFVHSRLATLTGTLVGQGRVRRRDQLDEGLRRLSCAAAATPAA